MSTTTAPTLARASSGVTDDHAAEAPVLMAVSYLRVSTREQAERGGTEEGFSIPAQREANRRKADELGARVVREFIDAGESARSADRDGLQEMLAFIAATRVQFCLVHKLDRLARNRADDVKIHEALLAAGVTLVSATESIDQTPSGMLVHGIMSSIAEFYSRNLATEVTKGLTQKVAQGGTPMRAPIGYLNVRRTNDAGREMRTVEVDPERAPLIRWAFQQYAGGETSVTGLLRDLTTRGLVTVPTPKRPSKPLGKNTLYKLLTNPYYAGVIRYKGALHPGAHEPLIDPALFDQVQSLLRARTAKMTRHVQHAHHLKGLLHCGTCGSRMLLDFATNPKGVTYAYFVCSGRASKRTTCTRRAVPVAVAERLVADSYASITISDTDYRDLAAQVDAAFDTRMAGRDQEIADLMANCAKLESESDKLLAAHFADAIDLPTLKRHQDRIRAGLADVNRKLAEHDEHHTGGRAFLHDSLRLLTDAHHAYARSGDADRRLACQAFYTRLDITDDEQLRPRLGEPFATIIREAAQARDDEGKEAEHDTPTHVTCSRKTLWVVTLLLELPTGGLADSWGRRPVIVGSSVLQAASVAAFALAGTFPLIVAAAMTMGAARALSSGPVEAWFVDAVHGLGHTEIEPGLARGQMAEALALGAGAVIGGVLPSVVGLPSTGSGVIAFSIPFLIAAAMGVVHAVAAWLLLTGDQASGGSVTQTVGRAAGLAVRVPGIRRLMIVAVCLGIVLSGVELVSPDRVAQLVGSATTASAVFGVLTATAFVVSAFGAGISTRLPGRRALVGALAYLGIGVLVMGLALPWIGAAALIYLLVYVGVGVQGPVAASLLHARIDSPVRSTMMSLESLSLQAGGAVASLVVGWLVTHVNLVSGLAVMAAAGGLAGVTLLRDMRHSG